MKKLKKKRLAKILLAVIGSTSLHVFVSQNFAMAADQYSNHTITTSDSGTYIDGVFFPINNYSRTIDDSSGTGNISNNNFFENTSRSK